MIESIIIVTNDNQYSVLKTIVNNKLVIDLSLFNNLTHFDIVITFKNNITAFRNHDYTWVNCKENRIATEFSPKIVKIGPSNYVQANLNCGIWEIDKKQTKTLLWRFNPQNAYVFTTYSGNENQKIINQSNNIIAFTNNLELLFSTQNAVEFSRSSIPFSAITCFTDHCDFDTANSLQIQREFFKENSIKVTKGFFMNHFSKRNDNPSFENDANELTFWKNDGHELAYHSLSQSIKTVKESLHDFFNFKPPFNNITTWIDHGFQPYNFSLFQNFSIDSKQFSENIKSKNIEILWNYIDSGTATIGVINQLNPNHFTLESFSKGINNIGFVSKMGQIIKNIVFHYYADEKIILKYKHTASYFKQAVYQKKISALFKFLYTFITLIIPIGKVFIFWNLYKNKPYKLAKYSPLFFKHHIYGNPFYVFQTLEMIDFKKALHQNNVQKLIEEKGVFIAHTYFSVPMKYHIGKMFKNPTEIDQDVAKNFNFLGVKIKNKEIWNPTLNELVVYFSNFEKTLLDVDIDGNIFVKNTSNLTFRLVE